MNYTKESPEFTSQKKKNSKEAVLKEGKILVEDSIETIKNLWTNICVRVPVEMLRKLDERKNRTRIGISRNAYILELLQKQLATLEKTEPLDEEE